MIEESYKKESRPHVHAKELLYNHISEFTFLDRCINCDVIIKGIRIFEVKEKNIEKTGIRDIIKIVIYYSSITRRFTN